VIVMGKRTVTPIPDPGLAEIDAWIARFRAMHEARLSSPSDFPDRHLVEQERARIAQTAAALEQRMKADYAQRQGARRVTERVSRGVA
jgi:hypothetical protein